MMNAIIAHLAHPCAALEHPDFEKLVGSSQDKFGTGEQPVSKTILRLLRSNMSVYALMTHLLTKPEIPAVVAVEDILLARIGPEALTDDMKQYTGWRVRQIIEFLGGSWVRAGVRIRGSNFKSGSTYSLPADCLHALENWDFQADLIPS